MRAETIPTAHVSWNKIWTVIGVLGIPAFSVLYMFITGGQKLIDKVDSIVLTLSVHSIRLDKIESKQEQFGIQLDTVVRRQERNNIINQSYQIYNPYRIPRTQWRTVYKDANGNPTFNKP